MLRAGQAAFVLTNVIIVGGVWLSVRNSQEIDDDTVSD